MNKEVYIRDNVNKVNKWEVYGETKDTYKIIDSKGYVTEVYKNLCILDKDDSGSNSNGTKTVLYSTEKRGNGFQFIDIEDIFGIDDLNYLVKELSNEECYFCGKEFNSIDNVFVDVDSDNYTCRKCIDDYRLDVRDVRDLRDLRDIC